MKNASTRILALLLAVLLLVGLTACKKKPVNDDTSSGYSDGSSEPDYDESDPDWDWGYSEDPDPNSTDGSTTAASGDKTTTKKTTTKKTTTLPPLNEEWEDVSTPSTQVTFNKKTNEAGTEIVVIDSVKGETVTLLCVSYDQFAADGTATKYLKDYYDITVKTTNMPNDQLPTEFTTAFLGGKPYDLVTDMVVFPTFVTQNVIEPLTNRLDFTTEDMAKYKHICDAYTYRGHNYFLPWVADTHANVYFNIEMFEDANVDIDGDGKKGDDPYSLFLEGKWTWSNFKKAAQMLHKVDQNGSAQTWGLLTRNWTDSKIPYMSGQLLAKEVDGKYVANLNNPDYQRIFGDYVAMINDAKVCKRGGDEIYNMFNNNKAAMLYGPSYMSEGQYFSKIWAKMNVGQAPAPKDDGSKEHKVGGICYGFWVTKGGFYRKGEFNCDLLNAFISGAMASEKDGGNPKSVIYQMNRDSFVKKWSKENKKFTNAWYDDFHKRRESISEVVVPVVDPYSECMNLNQVIDVMTGWGDQPPSTFAAAVNMFEGQLTQALEDLNI